MTRGSTEIFDCERVNSYLESYLLDRVPPPERRGMRLHIHRCPDCFRKVAERDPLQLFAPLADEERGEQGGEGFWPAIREGIAREESRRSARRIRMRVAAILAAVAALGVLGAIYLIPRQTQAPIVAEKDTPAATAPAPPTVAARAAEPFPQTVERVRTAGGREVQVYSMNVYDQPSAIGGPSARGQLTELVLIVDAGIDL